MFVSHYGSLSLTRNEEVSELIEKVELYDQGVYFSLLLVIKKQYIYEDGLLLAYPYLIIIYGCIMPLV